MNLSDTAPEGAGWYITAFIDSQPQMSPVLIHNENAMMIASVLSQVISNDKPKNIVASGNGLVKTALEQQLKYAEEQASKIGTIRQRLSQLESQSPDTIETHE